MAHKRILEIKVNFIIEDDEVAKLIHGIGEREWLAVRQIILEDIETETQFVTDAEDKNPEFTRGRLAALRDVLYQLSIARTKGEKVPEEAEE